MWQASSQHWLCIDADAWCKRALGAPTTNLLTADVLRREGNVITRQLTFHQSVKYKGEGTQTPIMLCNISQNAMGQTLGGGTPPPPAGGGFYFGRSCLGGAPSWPGGYPSFGYPALPGTLVPGESPTWPDGRERRWYRDWGVPWSGTPPPPHNRMYPGKNRYLPLARSLQGGVTQVGQQKEYSIHGWRFASCGASSAVSRLPC